MKNPLFYLPSDPLFKLQWHLFNQGNTPGSIAGYDINVLPVWPDYTGAGVLIGIVDEGMDNTHPDLVPNYRPDLAWDLSLNQANGSVKSPHDNHGVAVAGLAASTQGNGIGGVGVAWGSEFTMYRMDLNDTSFPKLLADYQLSGLKAVQDGIAISSNSWGPGPQLNQDTLNAYHAVSRYMAEAGRDGLGIVSLFAGGNDREEGMNANYDPTDNSPWAIIVAASYQNGGLASYSTPSASLLISAPGSGAGDDLTPYNSIVTTDRQSSDGYNTAPGTAGDYEYGFNGTSAATPIAAGVVALMLEANSKLGYRDVQEILVYSAQRATFLDRDYDHAFNGSSDWNGGALLASHDFGYGHIDAHAAVRLTESWMNLGTAANLVLEQGVVAQPTLTINAGQYGTASAHFAAPYRLEQMTVTVDIEADALEALIIELISPDGVVSELMNMPVLADAQEDDDFDFDFNDDGEEDADEHSLHYTFNTVLNWGSDLAGEWTLKVTNALDEGTVQLNNWSLLAYTAGQVNHGTQIFTDEFAHFAALQSDRSTLSAANGSTLNAAAVTSDVRFDLTGSISAIGDQAITLQTPHTFLNLVSGDGDDTLIGNNAANILMAGRGNNHLDGKAGLDVARLIGDRADYLIEHHSNSLSIQSTALSGGGLDSVYNIELLHFADQVVLAHTPLNLNAYLFDEASYLGQNPDVAAAIHTTWLTSGLEHYQFWGAAEGRNPNALFNEQWYLAQNTDVAQAIQNAQLSSGYQHYMHWGWTEARDPSAWMDTQTYLANNSDVAAAELNPLQHYMLYGIHEGRTISAVDVDMWA